MLLRQDVYKRQDLNVNVVELMRKCVEYAIKLEKTCATWFEKTIELGYFEKV